MNVLVVKWLCYLDTGLNFSMHSHLEWKLLETPSEYYVLLRLLCSSISALWNHNAFCCYVLASWKRKAGREWVSEREKESKWRRMSKAEKFMAFTYWLKTLTDIVDSVFICSALSFHGSMQNAPVSVAVLLLHCITNARLRSSGHFARLCSAETVPLVFQQFHSIFMHFLYFHLLFCPTKDFEAMHTLLSSNAPSIIIIIMIVREVGHAVHFRLWCFFILIYILWFRIM